MFDKIKKRLSDNKVKMCLNYGFSNDLVKSFEPELYKRLDNVIFAGIPASIQIKYLKPMLPPGKCFERSYLITMGFDDCLLVCGDRKDMELAYGKEAAWHYWVEKDGWVYDPTMLLKIEKNLYYKAFGVTVNTMQTKEELMQDENYRKAAAGEFDKFILLSAIPLVEGIARLKEDMNFIKEVEEYKQRIGYNYAELSDSLNDELYSRILKKQVR